LREPNKSGDAASVPLNTYGGADWLPHHFFHGHRTAVARWDRSAPQERCDQTPGTSGGLGLSIFKLVPPSGLKFKSIICPPKDPPETPSAFQKPPGRNNQNLVFAGRHPRAKVAFESCFISCILTRAGVKLASGKAEAYRFPQTRKPQDSEAHVVSSSGLVG
jgi:hypothetical protein